jgi:hypothetical protein
MLRIPRREGRHRKLKIALFALAAVGLGCVYAFRQDLRDAWSRRLQGPIPEEVSYADAIGTRHEPSDEPVIEMPAKETGEDVSGTAAEKPVEKPAAIPLPTPAVNAAPAPAPKPTALPKDIPAQMNLKVPFILQAPFKIWDEVHEDACEEASALMLQAYYQGETGPLTPEEMDRRILAVVDHLVATYGDYHNSDAELTAKFMREFLGLDGATVKPVASADDIRRQIAAGRPVIIPADGRLLKNPNFRHGGPPYHMLVLKGYRADGAFIANDPGTRLGENYVYTEEVVMDAVHDWNGGDTAHGARLMIVVED